MNIEKNQKRVALTLLRYLFEDEIVAKEFSKNDGVMMSEGETGHIVRASGDRNVMANIKSLNNRGDLVYHVVHTYDDRFDYYEYLLVSKFPEDWDFYLDDAKNYKVVPCYVQNMKKPMASEFGDCEFKKGIEGGLVRVFG